MYKVKMKIKLLKMMLALMLFCSYQAIAADFSVSIRDTLIPSGKIYEIPVYGKIHSEATGEIAISFNYNGLILDVSTAKGSASLGFQDSDISTTTNATDWSDAVTTVRSSNYSAGFEGILFYLTIEALVGPDTLALFRPINFKVAGEEVGAVFVSGTIRTTPPIVNQKYKEGIGNSYPNPFNSQANVKFTIEEESKVKFHIYSTLGRLVEVLPDNAKYIEYQVFNSKNELIENADEKMFEPGVYLLKFKPKNNEFSSGVHYIIMETKKGIYTTNFVYVK